MPEFVGFQTMGILVPYGITFDAVGVFGLAFQLLFKSCSTYCAIISNNQQFVHKYIEFSNWKFHNPTDVLGHGHLYILDSYVVILFSAK